jgi:hypothetical protein
LPAQGTDSLAGIEDLLAAEDLGTTDASSASTTDEHDSGGRGAGQTEQTRADHAPPTAQRAAREAAELRAVGNRRVLIGLVTFGLIALVSVIVALTLPRGHRSGNIARCVRAWNAPANTHAQAKLASELFGPQGPPNRTAWAGTLYGSCTIEYIARDGIGVVFQAMVAQFSMASVEPGTPAFGAAARGALSSNVTVTQTPARGGRQPLARLQTR